MKNGVLFATRNILCPLLLADISGITCAETGDANNNSRIKINDLIVYLLYPLPCFVPP